MLPRARVKPPRLILEFASFTFVTAPSAIASVSTASSASSEAPTASAPICAFVMEFPVIFAPGISPSEILSLA